MSPTQLIRRASKAWHGIKLYRPDWGPDSHSIAFTVELHHQKLVAYFILNAYWEPLEFELPPVHSEGDDRWRRWIDTALDSPQDIVPWEAAPSITVPLYRAEARSVVVLYAWIEPGKSSMWSVGREQGE